jgi:hypothetical protein
MLLFFTKLVSLARGGLISTAHVTSGLAKRGSELRDSGLTVLRIFRALKREFPHAETQDLWIAAGADMGTVWQLWAYRSAPRPASIRNDPRK